MKFSGKPLPNMYEAPGGEGSTCGGHPVSNLRVAISLRKLSFSLQSVKWGNKTVC